MSKPVILTGIRANNDLTIGNYFGAILPIIDMAKTQADKYQINLFVPDLHSFTTPVEHSNLQQQIMHNVRLFVAAGLPLDNAEINIYRQSYIPAHSELTWILDCFTGFGEMSRMTQFKDKSQQLANDLDTDDEKAKETVKVSTSVGLFNYPVLMAADILLYGAEYVPVGDDQSQHLEFTRDIAERINAKFHQSVFTIPKSAKEQHEFFGNEQGLRIKDLTDPMKKMSKSDDTGKGVIFLGDDPDEAAKKVMSATTDSFGEVHFNVVTQPGVSNLLQILALLTGKTQNEVVEEWAGRTSYGDLKSATADAVKAFLTNFQVRLSQVDDAAVLKKLELSEQAMNTIANKTLLKVQRVVGLRS
jgi:tryptophanyl-tRNA synthetase